MNEIVTAAAAAAGVVVIDHDGEMLLLALHLMILMVLLSLQLLRDIFVFPLKSQFKALALIKFQFGSSKYSPINFVSYSLIQFVWPKTYLHHQKSSV